MNHIELLGAFSVGEPTIFSEPIGSNQFYVGTEEDAMRWVFSQITNIGCQTIDGGSYTPLDENFGGNLYG